ncbi:MAG TPA: hypothetical protein VHO46_08900 [Bacteroidales bacterium]|nr:hypothetical protein [Bacteroidales bacterium]
MELIKNIRLKIGNNILRKKVEKIKRKVCYSNIEFVKKIGIVWDASQVDDFAYLSKFCQTMNEKQVEVKIIGYYAGKNLPDRYTAQRYLNCLRREEVSFFYLPVSYEAESFINKRFDVLIDINFKNLLPLKYISSLSNAALKVGLSEHEKSGNGFDLMIDLKKPVRVDTFLEQTIHYLEMIHAEQAEKIH